MIKHISKLSTQSKIIDKQIEVMNKMKDHYADLIELQKDMTALQEMEKLAGKLDPGYQDSFIVEHLDALNNEFNFDCIKWD